MEWYFSANYVVVDYEVAMFLCKWHADEFVSLWTSERKSLVEVKELLISHYSPKPILIYDRFKFHHRNQHESETVDQFVVELKRLMLKCELKLLGKKCCGTASFGDWKVCKFRRGCWQKETWLFLSGGWFTYEYYWRAVWTGIVHSQV